MKLICIKNKFGETNRSFYTNDQLELGKVYNTFSESDYYDKWRLITIYIDPKDLFSELQYPKEWFVPLEENRENIINKILYD